MRGNCRPKLSTSLTQCDLVRKGKVGGGRGKRGVEAHNGVGGGWKNQTKGLKASWGGGGRGGGGAADLMVA